MAANSLRQAAFIQTQAKLITAGGRQIGQTFVQVKDKSCRHQGAERNGRVAAFKPPQCVAADKETPRHVVRGDAALATRECEITPQLAKRTFGGQRQAGGRWQHKSIVCYNSRYVNLCLI